MFESVAVVSYDSFIPSQPYSAQTVLADGVDVGSRLFYRQSLEIYVVAQQC